MSESLPLPLPYPTLPVCLRQRSGRCRVFLKQKRWAALHLLSDFLSGCLHFRSLFLFNFFVSPQYYTNAMAVLYMPHPCIHSCIVYVYLCAMVVSKERMLLDT